MHTLLAAGLRETGYTQALQIMAMENILGEREVPVFGIVTGDFRSSDQYFLAQDVMIRGFNDNRPRPRSRRVTILASRT